MQRFRDFATDEQSLEGEKRKIDELLNHEITVCDAKIKTSQFQEQQGKKYMTLQVEKDGQKLVCHTGSQVLVGQVEKYREHMPFLATIRKIDRYYTFA